jgi:hypothetical protein
MEHISLDGVIQAPGGPEEDPTGFCTADGRGRMPTRMEERASSRLTARLRVALVALTFLKSFRSMASPIFS